MFRLASKWVARTAVLSCLVAAGCGDDSTAPLLAPDGGAATAAPTARLLVFSDPHYFDPSLGTTGAAFEAHVARDRKLIAESDAIMRAMVAAVEAEHPQAVLISGDLTKDGEFSSHTLAAGYFRQMQAGGRKVFVVPGNHDIANGGASSYDGDVAKPVPSVSAADFAAIYGEMGYGAAIARDPGSLSYLAEIASGLWLLAIDSCIYGDAPGTSITAGSLRDTTKAWIQTQLGLAASQGKRVIAMMHHGLVEHFGGQAAIFPEYLVADRDAVAGLLSSGGVGAVFTGHFHANDITQGRPGGATRSIYDIETGSAATYPCPYRIADVSGDRLTITTKHILAIDYDLRGAPDFQTYAHDRLRLGLETLIANLIEQPPYSATPTQASQLSPWLGDGLVAHYAGDEVMSADVPPQVQSLLVSGNNLQVLAGAMLQSIWTDLAPGDNTLVLDLAAR